MSIQSEMQRLNQAKANLKTAITGKGVAVSDSAKLDTYYALVNEIQQGGGSSMEIYKCTSVDTVNKTWSGYKAILSDNIYSFADTVTTGLTYGKGLTPTVGKIYDTDVLFEVKYLFNGLYLVSPTAMTSDQNDEWDISCSSTRTNAYEAFNGADEGYGWESADYNMCPHWLQWKNKLKKVQVISYEMKPNNNTGDYNLGRFPNSWTLQGSQDGQSWVNIDIRSNVFDDYYNIDAAKYYEFTCQNPGYYYYYRIYVSQNANGVNDYVYIGQIKAYGSFE